MISLLPISGNMRKRCDLGGTFELDETGCFKAAD